MKDYTVKLSDGREMQVQLEDDAEEHGIPGAPQTPEDDAPAEVKQDEPKNKARKASNKKG